MIYGLLKLFHKFISLFFINFLIILLASTISVNCNAHIDESSKFSPIDFVNPFIGTANESRWFYFTPASLPFGLVKLSPQTSGFGGYKGGGNAVGYNYNDKLIYGFSHVHEFQLGGVLVMPLQGSLSLGSGEKDQGFASTYKKSSEHASPGYYSVTLDKGDIGVELTATKRAGYHSYKFHRSNQSKILVDIGHLLGESGIAGKLANDAVIKKVDNKSIAGFITFTPPYASKPVTIYMAGEFNKPFESWGMYRDSYTFPRLNRINGPNTGFYGNFSTYEGERITLKIGISFVSEEQARLNYKVEIGDLSFDLVHKRARKNWNEELGKIEVFGGTKQNKVKFYTALWHVLLGRGISSDVNGKYISSSGAEAQIPFDQGVPEFERFNSDSFWGGYWTINQLWPLVYPEKYKSFIRFMLNVYDEGGWLPDGYLVNQYIQGMPSNYSTFILAPAIMNGMKGIDFVKSYAAIKKNQDTVSNRPFGVGMEGLSSYLRLGYIPYEEPNYGSTSDTLEYAFQDWCASQIAQKFGRNQDERKWSARSKNYKNVFDIESKMFRPRSKDGVYYEKFNPLSGFSFAEGNAWQYLWFVPQDINSLISLLGKDLFITRLTGVLQETSAKGFSAGNTNTSGYHALRFNPGNQTDLHISWLFNLIGMPQLTQFYNRKIMDIFFGATPEKGYGYGQDEDQGQIASWFVLTAIGLFDVQGGCAIESKFQVSTPLFDHVIIHLNRNFYLGRDFSISVKRPHSSATHIKSATLNGVALRSLEIPLKKVIEGGELVLLID